MAYRKIIEGPNSISDLLSKEFSLNKESSTKIIVAIETNDTVEKNISLYGKSRSQIDGFSKDVTSFYKSEKTFLELQYTTPKGILMQSK
jgi:hypothetical protein